MPHILCTRIFYVVTKTYREEKRYEAVIQRR